MRFIARQNEEGFEQPLIDHLMNVAKKTASFARKFSSEDFGYLIGLLHDIGKYSDAFQRRIRGSKEHVDHSTAGLQLAFKEFPKHIALILGFCIAGHHGGLPDSGTRIDYKEASTLSGRLKKDLDDYSNYKKELQIPKNFNLNAIRKMLENSDNPSFSLSFYIRMLFSCLVDADFLDTECFMNPNVDRSVEYDFEVMWKLLQDHLDKFENRRGVINEKRREILNKALASAERGKGIFRLTVPTGGGKTLTSMAFAMKHLLTNKMDRIIYIIPYTSIIEQTGLIFREIFGPDLVLEHHYNFNFEETETGDLTEQMQKLKLATENWNHPIIITTNVQFFESLFSNRNGRCRKLHNICNSVLIFDEVQMFPYDLLIPMLSSIKELVSNYSCTALFSSATQPNFESVINRLHFIDLIDNPKELNEIFRRTKINNIGKISSQELVEEIRKYKQALVIVNTRKRANQLKQLLGDKDCYCLSTLMTPRDRELAIKRIKERLKADEDCIVISTQIVEAGVDIDFPVVYREVAGIDSIIQAAGRCNREGKKEIGMVHVFWFNDYKPTKSSHLNQGVALGGMLINEHDDVLDLDVIDEYFNQVFTRQELDYHKILNYFTTENGKANFNFKTAADKFRLIDDEKYPVVIPNDENRKLLHTLVYSENYWKTFRELQTDMVMLYYYEIEKLFQDRKIKALAEKLYVLADYLLYDSKSGLNIYYGEPHNLNIV
ncbi:MAG: CRISPR-associated helicase Cas3' [Bacilli bacterium]|jgi:CRISPR-associated endonuclease/helicase Cas3